MEIKEYDEVIAKIATYAWDPLTPSAEAMTTAKYVLADSLGCAILALQYRACTKLLGPIVPGTVVPHGCHVPGTNYVLDPVCGAFNIGTMIRWLDFNDAWLAAEWGHPSDNLGGLIAMADFLCRNNKKITIRDLLIATIKAHEIQGVLALGNSLNRIGFDHVLFVKVASAAVTAAMLGKGIDVVASAVSNAWIDTGSLRTYRHAPSVGSRKSWAAGDATSRGVFLALLAAKEEMGYPKALTSPKWGFNDVLMRGKPLVLEQPLGWYVMENILFKLRYPAEFHSQTALEAAVKLHPMVKDKIDQIEKIVIDTHDSAVRIIDKKGPLKNPADRDHCIQYIVAIGLLKGGLTADDYEDAASKDPRIDALRDKMVVIEDKQYSVDYLDPQKRSIASAVTIEFKDGTKTPRIEVEYPIGHRRRRQEGIPDLYKKLEANLGTHYAEQQVHKIRSFFDDTDKLLSAPVSTLVDVFS